MAREKGSVRIGPVSVFALVVILGLTALLVLRPRSGPLEAAGEGYVRTVTLERGTLEDSISATGTVESSQVSTVTTDDPMAYVKNLEKDGELRMETTDQGEIVIRLECGAKSIKYTFTEE